MSIPSLSTLIDKCLFFVSKVKTDVMKENLEQKILKWLKFDV